jgi:hypothetical protein
MMFTKTKLMELEQQKINSLGHILRANFLSKEEKITVYQLRSQKKTKER